jgi:hypothetical protein
MQLNPNDIRINHYHLGHRKGSEIEAIYLPTGESVAASIPADSTETDHTLHARLLSALKMKIQKAGQAREGKTTTRRRRRKAP